VETIHQKGLGRPHLAGVGGILPGQPVRFYGTAIHQRSLERIILFAYPALVLVLGWLLFRQKISGVQQIALALTYGGIVLVMVQPGGETTHDGYWLGVILVFLGALAYAIYLIGGGKLIPRLGSVAFTTAALLISTLAVIVHAIVIHRDGWPKIDPVVIEYGLWMGVVSTFIPTYLVNYSIRQLGASNASLIATLGPITTIGLSYLVLGERLTAMQWLGSLLVVVGVIFISVKGKSSATG
jgi:drug/metabolite transporter (DMT)-like permease